MAFPISGTFTESQIEKLNIISNDKANSARQKNQVLDKDAFLKLMTVQLQHQDPLSPLDNSQYISQMAQFSSVEQLANISSAITSNNNLNTTISKSLSELTELVKAMNGNNGSKDVVASQNKIIEQNEKIINQLVKMNQVFESYFGSSTNKSDDALFASLGL